MASNTERAKTINCQNMQVLAQWIGLPPYWIVVFHPVTLTMYVHVVDICLVEHRIIHAN